MPLTKIKFSCIELDHQLIITNFSQKIYSMNHLEANPIQPIIKNVSFQNKMYFDILVIVFYLIFKKNHRHILLFLITDLRNIFFKIGSKDQNKSL